MDNFSVCLLNDSFPPLIDGVANTVMNYADIIQKKYGKAVVTTPYFPGAEDNYPYEVIRYKSADTTKFVGYRAGNPFLPSTVDAVKKFSPNIIHSHCPFVSTYLARTLRGAVKAPVILTYHTMFDIDIAKAIQSKLIQKVAIHHLVANIEACDEVWVVSNGAGENLKKLGYKGDYVVMENGVDLSKGQASSKTMEDIYQTYHIPSDKPVFLFVGRMMWYKGVKIILDALSELKKEDFEFSMVFVGGGTDAGDIEKYAENCGIKSDCFFIGPVQNREQLRGFYCLCDLFLFPSTYDTNGLVVREAAACARPSLLIKGSCAAEGVVHGETGLLMEENAGDMVRVLREFGKDRRALRKIGDKAMEDIYISWETSIDKAVERYQYVIDNYKPGRHFFNSDDDYVSDEAFRALGKLLDGVARVKEKGSDVIYDVNEHRKNITNGIHDKIENHFPGFKK